MPTQEQLQEWDMAFSRIERVNDFCNLKKLYASIESQLGDLSEAVKLFTKPKNPRDYMAQVHDKVKIKMLEKQKIRLEEKINKLESKIKEDYKEFKKE